MPKVGDKRSITAYGITEELVYTVNGWKAVESPIVTATINGVTYTEDQRTGATTAKGNGINSSYDPVAGQASAYGMSGPTSNAPSTKKVSSDGPPTSLYADKAAATRSEPNSAQHKEAKALASSMSGRTDAPETSDQVTRKTRNWAEQVRKVSGSVQEVAASITNTAGAAIQNATGSIAGGIAGVSSTIDAINAEAVHDIQGWQADLKNKMRPFSSAIGSTLGSLENVARNPLGAPQLLADSAMNLLDKVSPDLANSINGAAKSLDLEHLANLPGQVMGSIRQLTLAADAILSVPFALASDIYNGLMDIMEEIANLIDSVVSLVFNLVINIVYGLLDAILPISEIMSFLNSVGELASFVGGIAQLTGGFSAVTNITNQVTNFTDNVTSMVNNPMKLAKAYIPGVSQALDGISNVTDTLRNPGNFLKGALPPAISDQLDKISTMPGLGFVANFNGSIGDALNGLQQGVFTTALDNLGKEYSSLLSPLHKQPSLENPTVDQQEAFTGAFFDYKYATSSQGTHGLVRLADTSEQKVFGPRASNNNRGTNTATSNGGTNTATFNGTTIREEADGSMQISGNGVNSSYNSKTGEVTAYGITGKAVR